MRMCVPEKFADVSDVREVPDNQEVFADIDTDQCIIVELLESDASVPDAGAASHYLEELAAHAGASSTVVTQPAVAVTAPMLPQESRVYAIMAMQAIAKFKEAAENQVEVRMFVARVARANVDVLVTLSTPRMINPSSSSAASSARLEDSNVAGEMFSRALQTIEVLDWSLFC
eukprot:m51a1_g3731 hypothetical protein (173) ;mRNA; r:27781-28497